MNEVSKKAIVHINFTYGHNVFPPKNDEEIIEHIKNRLKAQPEYYFTYVDVESVHLKPVKDEKAKETPKKLLETVKKPKNQHKLFLTCWEILILEIREILNQNYIFYRHWSNY